MSGFRPEALQFQRARGSTIEEMRKNLDPAFRALGDAIIVWVNEGSFWIRPLDEYPKQKRLEDMTHAELLEWAKARA